MISHEHKCIFIHIPKTAGTSINKMLNLEPDYEKRRINGHGGMAYHRKYFKKGYFSFSFCRNPWDRLFSAYFYLSSEKCLNWPVSNTRIHSTIKKYRDFKTFVNHIDESMNDKHFQHQHSFIQHPVYNIDFIGRFENLQEDFNTICDKIGIPQQELPHKNKTKHKHYTEYYDDETRQIVTEKYAKDIEYFGYEFGE
jgi:chondroitin 4-sulfotransferase 11